MKAIENINQLKGLHVYNILKGKKLVGHFIMYFSKNHVCRIELYENDELIYEKKRESAYGCQTINNMLNGIKFKNVKFHEYNNFTTQLRNHGYTIQIVIESNS